MERLERLERLEAFVFSKQMNQEELEEFFEENHKLLWLLTLYHTHEKLFSDFLKEKDTPLTDIEKMISLSKDFRRIFPAKFLELSKE